MKLVATPKPLTLLFTAVLLGFLGANGCGSVSTATDAGTGDAGKGGGGSGGSGGGTAGSGGGAGSSGSAGSGGGSGAGGSGHAGASGAGGASGGAGHDGGAGAGGSSGGAGHDGGAGAGGHQGDGGQSCTELQTEYANAFPAARSCDVKANAQCAHLASMTLSPCFSNCMTYVNDTTTLDAIKAQWLAAGCNAVPVVCPAIACIQPTGKMCVAADGGGGMCVTSNGLPTN
jgi:hypothetical protein